MKEVISSGLEFELVPSTDAQITAIDAIIAEM